MGLLNKLHNKLIGNNYKKIIFCLSFVLCFSLVMNFKLAKDIDEIKNIEIKGIINDLDNFNNQAIQQQKQQKALLSLYKTSVTLIKHSENQKQVLEEIETKNNDFFNLESNLKN